MHDRTTCDLGDFARLRDVIRTACPDLIVNAAAYTAVDKAETEHDLCYRINAAEAQAAGAWLVHYSTDYVFDDNKASPYTEDDATAPLNTYGRAKRAGEQAIDVATACVLDLWHRWPQLRHDYSQARLGTRRTSRRLRPMLTQRFILSDAK